MTHDYFGHDAWAAHAHGLKTLDDALHLRKRLLLAFEHAEAEDDPDKRAAWLSFAIVGAGPTGVELAGTLAEIARHTLRGEFRRIDPAAAKIRLVEAGPRVLAGFPESLSLKAEKHLERLGVEIIVNSPVTEINDEGYALASRFVPARTVVWAAGVAGSPLAQSLGAPLDRAGRVLVQPDLTIPGHAEIFVAGDLAAFTHERQAPSRGQAVTWRCTRSQADGCTRGARDPRAAWPRGGLARQGRKAAATRRRRSAIATTAISRRSDAWPRSSMCTDCAFPARSRGGSGCSRTCSS